MFTRQRNNRRSLQRTTPRRRALRLLTEALEDRSLLAVGVDPGPQLPPQLPPDDPTSVAEPASAVLDLDGTLRVYGTAGDDHITIAEGTFTSSQWDPVPQPGVIVTITDGNDQTLLSQLYLFQPYQNPISSVKVYAGSGNDTVENNTAIASYLYGGSGHDTLYGGLGNDELYGQDGNDGLFGGAGGTDYIDHGLGDNRILLVSEWNNYTWGPFDASLSTRTLITFEDSPATSVQLDEYPGQPFTYQPGEWQLNEVKLIDQAMAFLHHKQGNSDLLRDDGGGSSSLTINRVGYQDPHASGLTRNAWNDGSGNIYLTNHLFAAGPNRVIQIFLHEIGHNWDTENPNWQAFKDISGWTDSNPNTQGPNANYTASADGDWWYHTTATFAREYGRTNPKEDFGTAFAAYCMHEMGLPYSGTYLDAYNFIGWTVIPAKLNFIDDWLFEASSHPVYLLGGSIDLNAVRRAGSDGDSDSRDTGMEEQPSTRTATGDTFATSSDARTALGAYDPANDPRTTSTHQPSSDKTLADAVDQALLELFAEDADATDEFAALGLATSVLR